MRSTDRSGSIPVAVLLAGIFFVLLVAAAGTMSNQAKASSDLKDKLDEANFKLAESGMKTVDAPAGKAAKLGTKNETYNKDGISFSYPSGLIMKELTLKGGRKAIELLSREELSGNSVVAPSDAKATITPNLPYSFTNFKTESAKLFPYAKASRETSVNGMPVIIYTSEFNGMTMIQAIYQQAPDGPYTIVVVVPGTGKHSGRIADTLLTSLNIQANVLQED